MDDLSKFNFLMPNKNLKRILIVGDAGRGKSTLASKISAKLGIPHHSTDDFYYEVKFSKLRDRQESIDNISEVFKNEKWIIEGTTKHLIEPGLHSADLIIHLRYKNIPTQWLVLIKRYLKRDGEVVESAEGLLKLMRHVLYKKHHLGYRKGKLTPTEIIEPHKHKVITLSSFKEINNFLNSI
jgi:adenylate kinase family enzyme